ncbi:MAG: hypothetical protein ABI843_16995 [Dokdonella sp.]
MRLSLLAALCLGALSLSGCVDPKQIRAEQRAEDQQKCSDFGYAPQTDGFAHCMMDLSQKRDYDQQRQQDREARLKELALRRSGDERYPVCNAASPDTHLDISGFWYGEGCRAR